MARKEREAEIHPLQGEALRPPSEKGPAVAPRARRLSQWRAAAFFLSLFLGLAVAFAFSFAIPCPLRAAPHRAWSRAFEGAAAYAFLAAGDAERDGVRDLLVVLRADPGNGTGNRSCAAAGFASPCAFAALLSGANGSTLWERPVADDVLRVDCSVASAPAPACLVVGKPASLALLDLETGQTRWQEKASFGASSVMLSPPLKIPDVDGDGVPDVLVFAAAGEEIKSCFSSGTFHTRTKCNGSLHLPGHLGYLLHLTESGAHYLLFYTAKALFGYSLKQLMQTAFGSAAIPGLANLKEDAHWEALMGHNHQVPLRSSEEIQYVGKMSEKSGSHILIVRSATLELLDGQELGSRWIVDAPHILREPVLGAFDADEVDVAVERQATPKTKKVMIVGGASGVVKWEVELLSETWSPKPAVLATADHRSAFLFWGLYQGDGNVTGSWQQKVYLFHPSLPGVLLELSPSTGPILALEGLLLERNRHACYVLLVGPRAGSPPGQVVLSVQKLKEEISGSRVIWLNQMPQDTDQNVRNAFYRMRFRSLW